MVGRLNGVKKNEMLEKCIWVMFNRVEVNC